MRPVATSIQRFGVWVVLCCLSTAIQAQYFDNLSGNLPDVGASYQTKDVMAADIDGDGDMDIILANEFQKNIVLLNNGQGLFTEGEVGIPATEEHDSEAITIGDFNGDGFQDLVFVSEDDFQHEYYWSTGSGTFYTPPLFLPFTVCRAVLAADFNSDGAMDLMLGNNGQNIMLINNGTGEFINQTFERIPFLDDATQDIAAGDVNGDGRQDIFVANENGNHLLINNGVDVFVDESATRLPQGINMDSRAVLMEDVDLDGDIDIFLCNVAFAPESNATNRLYFNDGQGNFTDVTPNNLPVYTEQTLDAVFVDFDFDGDPDIIVANILGIPMGAYVNDGQGKFSDITSIVLGNGLAVEAFGIASADFNGDGYEDIYIGNRDGKDLLLQRNPSVLTNKNLRLIEAKVFPNPLRNNFVLEGTFAETAWDFQIIDTKGQRIQTILPTAISSSQIHLDFPTSLPNGIYFLELLSDKEMGMVRLLVHR